MNQKSVFFFLEVSGLLKTMDFVVILVVLQLLTVLGCQNHQHDFREEGFSVVSISVQSSVKWITKGKSRFLGITVSSRKDQGAVEINKRAFIKSAITVCTKCRMATGMVFMTLEQLKEIAITQPVLKALITKAIAAQ